MRSYNLYTSQIIKMALQKPIDIYLEHRLLSLKAENNKQYYRFEWMATSASFLVASVIKTNITSSLAMSSDSINFAVITRELSSTTSQYIYRLEIYSTDSLMKLQSIDIYQTYNTDKHYLAFIPITGNQKMITLTTINNLFFYRTSPLTKVGAFLHQQTNIYDLQASCDGQLTVLVADTVAIYRNNGFQPINFNNTILNARYCDFSLDGLYMGIASNNMIFVYTYKRSNDQYTFNLVSTNTTAPTAYGAITSFQFNPTNSSQMVVGFLNVSPMAYALTTNTYYPKLNDIQPMGSQNQKVARYMPDGQRFYSYDYLNGIGLWPGPGSKLYYQEQLLLYGAAHDRLGTKLIGHVWQNIRVVNIVLACSLGEPGMTCTCPTGFIWDYGSYQCLVLFCLKSEYSTGVIRGNVCLCIQGYIFSPIQQICILDCSLISMALPTMSNNYQCYCANNWSWNSVSRICVFNCIKVPFSSGVQISALQCGCLPGFQWDSSVYECVCPPYMQYTGIQCVCIQNYYRDLSGQCLANCTKIANAVGNRTDFKQCECDVGYYYVVRETLAGCQLNCSAISNTIQQRDFSSCICRQNMSWSNKTTCVLNCQLVQYSAPYSLGNNTCPCAISYIWVQQILECVRNCSSVNYTVFGGKSTLISCPCISKFEWDQTDNLCKIQCNLILNSEDYSLSAVDECQCRQGFNWNPSNFTCQVNCGAIWNAQQRINDSVCACASSTAFDSTSLTCASVGVSSIFSSDLAIAGFAIGGTVILIIIIVLIRFCWRFASQKGKEKKEKVKGKERGKKDRLVRKQLVNNEPDPDFELATHQRFPVPVKPPITKTTI